MIADPSRRARLTLAFILALPLIIAGVASALAHSWYPQDCGSDRDCWPTGIEADAREPDPIATPAGWRLHDGTVVPFNRARPSPDGRFHVCRQLGSTTGAIIRPPQQPPCLWAPQPGT